MTRRKLRPVARLFSKRRPHWPRLAGALLLTFSLGVAGFGIATAVYLERPEPSKASAAAQIPAVQPAPPHDPLAAAAAVPVPAEAPPPAPADLPALEPQAGATLPPQAGPPPQEAALEPPPTAPALAVAAAPAPEAVAELPARYWVEYGAFAYEPNALRLQRALNRQGLAAVIVTTHGRDGRKLLRVRSAPLPDLAAARQAVDEASRALRVSALLHRGSPAAAPAPVAQYRVQFAAFLKPAQAHRLSRELSRGGIATNVSMLRRSGGKPLYLVRSLPVPDHAQALALGERAQQVAQTGFVIEVSLPHAATPRQAAHPPPHHVADSR